MPGLGEGVLRVACLDGFRWGGVRRERQFALARISVPGFRLVDRRLLLLQNLTVLQAGFPDILS